MYRDILIVAQYSAVFISECLQMGSSTKEFQLVKKKRVFHLSAQDLMAMFINSDRRTSEAVIQGDMYSVGRNTLFR